jgi:heme-degrading monooxygenase HmoA
VLSRGNVERDEQAKIVWVRCKKEVAMSIVRLIYVSVKGDQVKDAVNLWKEHCAPLMIKQPGCLSEKLLECVDAPNEFISYSEWDSQESIDKYRNSEAHAEIQRHSRGLQGGQATVKRYAVK